MVCSRRDGEKADCAEEKKEHQTHSRGLISSRPADRAGDGGDLRPIAIPAFKHQLIIVATPNMNQKRD